MLDLLKISGGHSKLENSQLSLEWKGEDCSLARVLG